MIYIGNCHYRKLWLNDKNYFQRNKGYLLLAFECNNLLTLLKIHLSIRIEYCVQVQPIIFNNKNLFEDFHDYSQDMICLEESVSFLSP